ncbi:MAG: hypothetical protein AAFR87_01020 [Bacteroidota bacterium]
MSFRKIIASLIFTILTSSSLYPTIYTVTNVGDAGAGSLREAITLANTATPAALDTIDFNIGGIGTKTITLLTVLPNITDSVFIDGSSDPSYAINAPVIEINAQNLFTWAFFLSNTAPGSHIRGIIVNRCTASGIVTLANNTTITACFVGTDATGLAASANTSAGIEAQNVDNVTIGGANAGDGNLISGNGMYGIRFTNVDTASIVKNLIGTNISGDAAIANGTGISTILSNVIGIGGGTGATRNIISGNGVGIDHLGSKSEILGNYIGTNLSGNSALPNLTNGITIQGDSNLVGGTLLGQGNLISGNLSNGVSITSANSIANQVIGNRIGTNATGTGPVANAGNGVDFSNGAKKNIVGGNTAAARNIISGNSSSGIGFNATDTNYVYGNFIGTDINGTATIGNGASGIAITSAENTIIGDATAAGANVISGNGTNGISIGGVGGDLTIIKHNYIGTDLSGLLNLANTGRGVLINTGALDTEIGGIAAGEGNFIANNLQGGVEVNGAPTLRHSILSNSIYDHPVQGIKLSGGNNLQAAPVLTGFINGGPTSTISGTFNSAPNTTYRLEFFTSPTSAQGKTFIGTSTIVTDGTGAYVVNEVFAVTITAAEPVITSTATDPNGNTSAFGVEAVLSPQVLSFTAREISEQAVELDWVLEDSEEEILFEVELSRDGNTFQKIGEQEQFELNSGKRLYRFNTASLPGGSYSFRLKQIGSNGLQNYSPVIVLGIEAQRQLQLRMQNPVGADSRIELLVEEDQFLHLSLQALNGQEVRRLFSGELKAGQVAEISLMKEGSLPSGIYLLTLRGPKSQLVKKIIIE